MACLEPSLVARRIQVIRESRRMSRQELADSVTALRKAAGHDGGITYLQVYRIEKGIIEIHVDDVPLFADALGCSVGHLYREAKAS